MKRLLISFLFGSLLLLLLQPVMAQEKVVPLSMNPAYLQAKHPTASHPKTRALLPFIDDFSYEGPYPDPAHWADQEAYVNNTMGVNALTRGVVTLDGLNAVGRPYYPQPFNAGLADSLTTVPIDLSSYVPHDSIYLSFFYQPQGLGFYPESTDSLFLYFRDKYHHWVRMWDTKGTPLQPFKAVILPVTDTIFLHDSFQFRFVNIASLNTNDDDWNLDYIKLDANRNVLDTAVNDVAFQTQPTSLLGHYTSLPYRHFMANQAAELSNNLNVVVNNQYSSPQNVTVTLNATELISGTPLHTQTLAPVAIGSKSTMSQALNSYAVSFVAPGPESEVIIRNEYYYPPVNSSDRRNNDTIHEDVIFDNYFAYDDGSAEKSYFLLPATNFPSKTALQFHLDLPDTLRGLMVHFGPQAPSAAGKYFSIVLYHSLGAAPVSDSIIHKEDLYQVQYMPDRNGFSTYAFANPPVLDTGTYYIGITQPANFGSDSIYYGLDVNTNTASQYLAYNVDGTWYMSTITGTVMMRPIVGQTFIPTGLPAAPQVQSSTTFYPNPVNDRLYIQSRNSWQRYELFSMDGRRIMQGDLHESSSVELTALPEGIYILLLHDASGNILTHKLYKQPWN